MALIGGDVFVEVGEAQTFIRVGDTVETVPDEGVSKERVDAEFCAAVRCGDPESVRVPYAEALRTHRVGDALDRSVRAGAPVELGVGVDG